MKIGINGRFLRDPYTGIGQYTINLLREFARGQTEGQAGENIEFLVVVPDESCANLLKDERIDIPVVVLPEISWLPAGVRRHYWEQVQLRRFFAQQVAQHHVDRIFLPYVCAPWFGKYAAKTTMTIHDAIPWQFPEYRQHIFSKLAHWASRKSLTHVDQLITVSHVAARDIAAISGIPETEFRVIYNAPAEIFSEEILSGDDILEKFNLKKHQYALYVGGYDVRKQVGKLTRAWTAYGQGTLVLVGGAVRKSELYTDYPNDDYSHKKANSCASGAQASLTTQAEKPTIKIVTTGFLEDAKLAALYRGARVFLHFSRAEGFNIPVTQAMATTTPMLLSDTAVHHEIAGDSALYVNPDDESAVKESLARIWHNEALRSTLAGHAKERITHFTWSKSAADHLSLLTS